MADRLKAIRLASLEDWRIKAFNFGGPIGNVFSRIFELMHTVIRDKIANDQSVGYAMESLERERELALSRDEYADDAINSLIYAVADNLKAMIDSILEERRPAVEELPRPANSFNTECPPLFHVSKEEPKFTQFQSKAETRQETTSSSKQVLPKAPTPALQRSTPHQPSVNLSQKRAHEEESVIVIEPLAKKNLKDQEGASAPRAAQTSSPASPAHTAAIPSDPTPRATVVPALSATRTDPAPITPGPTVTPAPGHAAVVLHMCDTCGKSFESSKGLQRHEFTHRALRCNVCRKFVNPNKMTAHLTQYHGRRQSMKKSWGHASDGDEGVFERHLRTPSPTVSEISTATTIPYKTPEDVTPEVHNTPAPTPESQEGPTTSTTSTTPRDVKTPEEMLNPTSTITIATNTIPAAPATPKDDTITAKTTNSAVHSTPSATTTPAVHTAHRSTMTPSVQITSAETTTAKDVMTPGPNLSSAPSPTASVPTTTSPPVSTPPPNVTIPAVPITPSAHTTPPDVSIPATTATSKTPLAHSFPCKQCEKVFDTCPGLRRHEHVHDIVECPACGRDITRTRLAAHLRTHDQDTKVPSRDRIHCPIHECDAYRNSPSMMKAHLRTAHGVKPYACEHCPETFLLKTEQLKHKLTCGH